MQRIDAHVHLWDPARGDYGWLTPQATPLYRRFEHKDIKPLLDVAAIDGAVLIQAAPTAAETDYLLDIAGDLSWVLGVVGWTDLDAADADEAIARRARHPKFVGVRPMLQDIADPRWILDPRRSHALDAIQRHELAFDALIRPVHLDAVAQLASRYPRLNIVIDHAAKPAIGPHRDPSWQSGMRRLSRFDNVFCKLSGLMTELTPGTDAAQVEEYVLTLLTMFRPSHVIWGSDWPVLITAASYPEWLDLCQRCLANFDWAAQQDIMGGNAARMYRLGCRP